MKTNVTTTSRKSYAETSELRQTEKIRMRQFFLFHGSDFECCRSELIEPMQFPINHCTRCVYDLIEDGFLEVRGKKISPTSGKLVETIGLSEKGLLPQRSIKHDGFKHISEIIPECLDRLKNRMEGDQL